jgi:hypothetical protein
MRGKKIHELEEGGDDDHGTLAPRVLVLLIGRVLGVEPF